MKVLTFEEHSSVLAAWRELPRRPHTLAYLDARLDLQQVAPGRLRRVVECTRAQLVSPTSAIRPLGAAAPGPCMPTPVASTLT